MLRFVSGVFALLLVSQCGVAAIAQTTPSGPKPTIAVYIGSGPTTAAVASAFTDAMIQHLLSSGGFIVIDRQHMQQILGEQGMGAAGQVLPTTEAQLGRKLGANYVFTGQVVTFNSTVEDRTNIGTTLLLGAAAKSYDVRLDLTSNMEVIDVNSGAVLQSLQDHQTDVSPVYSAASGGGTTAQSFASQEYQKMVDAAAVAYVSKIDSSKFVASAPAKELMGHIMDISGSGSGRQLIISLGQDSGVTVGTILGVYEVKQLRNPDTGKVIATYIKRGTVQVTQVAKDYSVGSPVGSGMVTKLMVVRADQ